MTAVKFCGMTQALDVREAVRLGAAFVGVIFTASPRRVLPHAARRILEAADGTTVRRVGVFGREPLPEVVEIARIARLDVVQLQEEREARELEMLKETLGVRTWRVVRIGPEGLNIQNRHAFSEGDATVLDTMASGALGGTGRSFDWGQVADQLAAVRNAHPLVVAGGLRPGNVAVAVRRLSPDVVDVSSGVEVAPGVKDHRLMADFMTAARAAGEVE